MTHRLTPRQQKIVDKLLDEHCIHNPETDLAVFGEGWNDEAIRAAAEALNPDKDKPIAHAAVVGRRVKTIGTVRRSPGEGLRQPVTPKEIAELHNLVGNHATQIIKLRTEIADLRKHLEARDDVLLKHANAIRELTVHDQRLEAEVTRLTQLWHGRAYRHPDGRPISHPPDTAPTSQP